MCLCAKATLITRQKFVGATTVKRYLTSLPFLKALHFHIQLLSTAQGSRQAHKARCAGISFETCPGAVRLESGSLVVLHSVGFCNVLDSLGIDFLTTPFKGQEDVRGSQYRHDGDAGTRKSAPLANVFERQYAIASLSLAADPSLSPLGMLFVVHVGCGFISHYRRTLTWFNLYSENFEQANWAL